MRFGGDKWRFIPFPERSFHLDFQTAPSRFHRFMQRIFFGFRWEEFK